MERVISNITRRANGRQIVLYGCGKMAETLRRMLESTGCSVSFFVDRNYRYFHEFCQPIASPEILNPRKHFPVIVPFGEKAVQSITENCRKLGYPPGDWFIWSQDVKDDIVFHGVILGKRSQLSLAFVQYDMPNYIQSVGRYSSVNHSFHYSGDHACNLSTSSQLPGLLSSAQKANRLEIGHDVWIGANTFVNCSKVKRIGNGAVIGAGAVVLEDVPPYAIVVGVPAKVKKYRFTSEQIAVLEKVQWWNWSDEMIAENVNCFWNTDLFFEQFHRNSFKHME